MREEVLFITILPCNLLLWKSNPIAIFYVSLFKNTWTIHVQSLTVARCARTCSQKKVCAHSHDNFFSRITILFFVSIFLLGARKKDTIFDISVVSVAHREMLVPDILKLMLKTKTWIRWIMRKCDRCVNYHTRSVSKMWDKYLV